jgi:phosphatidylinositol alpha 1,6-mannosyltransferase
MPFYDDVRVGFSGTTVYRTLRSFKPDVVHLAAPLVLGGTAGRSARRMGIPVVAIFQTDIAGFARRYHLGRLAPSTITSWQLRENGLQDVAIWPRGVDADRFHPSKRDMQLHHEWAPQGQTIVGYVGRLAREKEVERLKVLSGRPGIKLVIVGDGPLRSSLEKSMPDATFTGVLRGEELARAFATLDVFVHTGLNETFCQAIQEALASGVPVVGPAAGGPLDIIQHRQNGLLWSPEHPESLAGSVQQLSEDVLLRRLLASHGRNSVVGRTWSSVMNDLIDHYQAVIGTTPLLRRTA